MIINKLILHNFGIYTGTNFFNLKSNKPVILIGGMNGRGKTTFLEAVLVALYGKRSTAFIESNYSFSEYLIRQVNKSDNSLESYIELEFEYEGEKKDSYIIKREWSLHNNQAINFKTFVTKNGVYDDILSENWDMFVEDLLPSAISPFFIFDGEKIAELANSDDIHLINSIKNLLGIDVIDQAIVDVKKIISSKKKRIKSSNYSDELKEIDAKIKVAEQEAKEVHYIVADLNTKKKKLEYRLREAENSFSGMGGNLANNRTELISKQKWMIDELSKIEMQLLDIVSGELPMVMIIPLLNDVLMASEKEKEQKAINTTLEQLPLLYQRFNKNGEDQNGFKEFLEFVKCNSKQIDSDFNLSEKGLNQLRVIYNDLPNLCTSDVYKIMKRKIEISDELSRVENYLSINISEEGVDLLYNEIKRLTTELAIVNEKLFQTQNMAESKHMYCEELKRQQLRLIEKAVADMEEMEDTKRIITYSNYLIKILEEYKVRLQKEKTNALANTMTECFKIIIAKKNLIEKITIDPISLEFIYVDKNGGTINKTSFSAGEKQLLVIAMLWALGKCSKKQFPIIVDTPLARLDSIHRETLIRNYFPEASEQTILLSTDSEIYGKYYDIIKPYVGREYTLIYNEEKKNIEVEFGYFGGEVY